MPPSTLCHLVILRRLTRNRRMTMLCLELQAANRRSALLSGALKLRRPGSSNRTFEVLKCWLVSGGDVLGAPSNRTFEVLKFDTDFTSGQPVLVF